MYKAITVSYEPKAKKMAQQIESKANEMEEQGYELVTVTATGSAKAVLVFRQTGAPAQPQETPAQA
ncbi:MAG: hypothetical protein PHY12_11695 [Eubacteriales bacterium]|nr:hypothetical protein [Eubacteriales bacterium]